MLHHQHKNLLTANRVAFMIIGFLEASWAPLVPYVKSAFAMDEASLGMLMLCSGVGLWPLHCWPLVCCSMFG